MKTKLYGLWFQEKRGWYDRIGLSRWILGASLLVVFASTSQAAVTGLPGQSETQSNLGKAIETICPVLAQSNSRTPDQTELLGVCGSMISNTLGLSDSDMLGALQDIAHEEIAAQGSMATETSSVQQANIGMRMSELLGKIPGASMANLQFRQNGKTIMPETLGFNPKYGERGGAAGDDDAGWGKFGVFVNGTIGFGDRDRTQREDAFDFDTSGITAGMDYRFTDNFVLGVAIGYSRLDVDIIRNTSASGGNIDANSYSLSTYGLYYLDNFYLNGMLTYTSNDYDIKRRVIIPSNNPAIPAIDRTASANTDSDQIALSLGGGYELSQNGWTYGPSIRIDYLDVDIDGYTETGAGGLNLQISSQDIKSLTSNLGAQVSYAISQNFGILIPQGRVAWVHEFKDESRSIAARYLHDPDNTNPTFWSAPTDNPDRNYFTLGLGVSGVFKGGMQAFFDYETILGLSNLSYHIFTVGVRSEF